MKKSYVLLIALCILSALTYSCGSKTNKKDAALRKAENAVKTDVTDVLNSVITTSTGGLGTVLIDLAMPKEKRDSLMYDPIKPIVHDELSKKTIEELKEIADNKTARVKFTAQCISANQHKISSTASETSQWIGALLDKYKEQ